MKLRKRFAGLFAVVLVIALALTVSLPAFAASPSITINNAEGLPPMTNGQFTAYQLFTGTPNKEGEAKDNEWGATSWNNWSLANIGWGNGITDPTALIEALKTADSVTWPEFQSDGANVFANLKQTDEAYSAEELAKILVENNNNAFLQAFSAFVVYGANRGTAGEGFLNKENGKTSTAVNDPENSALDKSTIDLADPGTGYYLVTEKQPDANAYDVVSEFILAVLADQTINLKASIPTVDKDMITATSPDETTAKGDAAGIGDTLTFRLTGTVANNIDSYDTYKYVFTDTLSKGLTYQYDAKVYVVRGGVKYEIPDQFYTINPTNSAKPEVITPPTEDIKITVSFNDLKNVTVSSLPDGKTNIIAGDEIIVEYTAVLNENAVIGSDGNTNEVFLEYSNNPHTNDTGKTTEKKVYVYSFGLDLKKVGSDKPDEGLAGASFVLKNSNGKYAKFKTVTEEDKNGRELVSWDDETTYNGEGNKEDNYYLTSGADGKIPNVYGLDEGTYTLQEVVTPAGYNTMDDLTITIAAQINEETGVLEKVTYTGSNGTKQEYTNAAPNQGVFQSGLLPDTLTNQKAPIMPFTGGIGTTVFYVIGGFMVMSAAVYLAITFRKKNSQNA